MKQSWAASGLSLATGNLMPSAYAKTHYPADEQLNALVAQMETLEEE